MFLLLFSIILILIVIFTLILLYNNHHQKRLITKKKNFEKFIGLKELKKDIEYFNNKNTILYFHCEILFS